MVILYKLAEQIIQKEKKIHVPSYYGIFKERDLEFSEVIIDDKYNRIDKQPDIIATTTDGEQYLIEFTFDYKIQHNKKIDYKNLNCIEIDLSSQTLESLHNFLLNSNECRKWLNNQAYFDKIESTYSQHDKSVKVINEKDCINCPIKNICCGIRLKGDTHSILIIENSGYRYRVCKTKDYENRKRQIDKEQQQAKMRKLLQEQELRKQHEREKLQTTELERIETININETKLIRTEQDELTSIYESNINPDSRTCFMCKSNLDWMCRNDGYAHCGPYKNLGVPKNTPPDTAKNCRNFRVKPRRTIN